MNPLTPSDISTYISILTPVILFVWFIYSRKKDLEKEYVGEIAGIYGGYTKPFVKPYDGSFESGIILNIKHVSSNGYFRGEFDVRQNDVNPGAKYPIVSVGIYSFYGKLKHRFSYRMNTHPLKIKRNRSYTGTLFIVDRLDISIEQQNINDFLRAEYKITHYREMGVMKFTLQKKYSELLHLPETFVLYKTMDLAFEPYATLKETVFHGKVHSE